MNIQERLQGGKWKNEVKNEEVVHAAGGQWWRPNPTSDDHGDRSEQVNRLRSMARVRAAFSEPGKKPPVWVCDFPRLVVVGDGNTGKSTVLNRFCEFDFSAVSDGVCTRRPIKLELRDASIANHERIRLKHRPLEAICTVFDYRGGNNITGTLKEEVEYEFPKIDPTTPASSCQVRTALRKKVELLASAADTGAQAAGDAEYTTDELVIRYESPGMIHFDLVDLPGIDNDHPMTEALMKEYINADTLDHTFMLIFQAAVRGSTAMKYSICVKLIKDVAAECEQQGKTDWLTSHCLGTLTMFDRVLPENSPDPPDVYDNKYGQQLADWINCTDHAPQALKFDWVTSLNPNREEQLSGMGFHDAAKKEQWFFEQLLQQRHPDVVPRCGMGSFRSVLVQKYESFATTSFLTDAETPQHGLRLAVANRMFTEVNQEMELMQTKWGWSPDEERYDDPSRQREFLREVLSRLLTSSNVTSKEQVLVRSEIKKAVKAAKSPSVFGGGHLQAKEQLKKPMEDFADFLKRQVVNAAQEYEFQRLPLMAEPVQDSITAFLDQFVDYYDGLLDKEIAEAGFIHANGGDKETCVHGLVFFMEKQLVSLAEIIAGLPEIPHHLLGKSPQPALAHTALHTVRVRQSQLSLLRCSDDFHVEEGLIDDPTFQPEPEPELELEPEPEPLSKFHPGPRVCAEYAQEGQLLPEGAILIKINNESCKSHGGLVGKARVDEITDGVAQDAWNVVTYVKSDRLIADYRADIIRWLLPENLHPEYLRERERFMQHRRAAEMVAIVFEDQLRAAGNDQYEQFERQNTRPLVRLGKYRSTPFEPGYKGPGLSAPAEMPTMAFVPLPGWCSTPGCAEPHDAYCNPCGHATCCWACLNAQTHCPVCNVEITGRFLCYPTNSLEQGQTKADYGAMAGSADGATPAPQTVAAVVKKYRLTDEELQEKRQQNKRVQQCMAQGCNAQLVKGNKHHCRCCGIKVCGECCGQRKKLLIRELEVAEGIPGTQARIQRKFQDQWRINWSDLKPPATMIEELNALSETDKVRPIQLYWHGHGERTFPTSGYAIMWVKTKFPAAEEARRSGSADPAEDYSWDQVCNDCKPDIFGMEMAVEP